MRRKAKGLLGIPIDDVSLKEATKRALELIEEYPQDLISRYIGTVNTDFCCQLYSWHLFRSYNQTLLEQLRASSLLIADGMPLVWLSGWLGSPLNERVTGIDFLHHLARELGAKKGSVYLLGGETAIANRAAKRLLQESPGLHIAGVSCPNITIEGEYLVHASEQDFYIVEEINRAKPDLLLLNLGNPKQEEWFSRVQHLLKVPVTVGVGGAFAFVAGAVPRAPKLWQQIGLEWLFRLIQEPRRLWKRYLKNAVLFPYYTFPLVVSRLSRSWRWGSPPEAVVKTHLLTSSLSTLAVIELPKAITRRNVDEVDEVVRQAFSQDVLLLDMRHLNYLDCDGIGWLVCLLLKSKEENLRLYMLGITVSLKWFFHLHRIWDLLAPRSFSSAKNLMEMLKGEDPHLRLFEAIIYEEGLLTIHLFGELSHHHEGENLLEQFSHALSQHPCVVHLSHCTGIDPSGMSFLLRLRALAVKGLTLKNPSPSVCQQLKNSKIAHLFSLQ